MINQPGAVNHTKIPPPKYETTCIQMGIFPRKTQLTVFQILQFMYMHFFWGIFFTLVRSLCVNRSNTHFQICNSYQLQHN